MTKTEATELVALLVAAYPRQTMPPASAEMYARMLMDLDLADARAACERLVKSSQYFPAISEIREQVAQMRVGTEQPATEAWSHMLAEVKRTGYYQAAGPPRITEAMRSGLAALGGWQSFCASEEPPGVLRAHFVKAYDEAMASQVRRANVGALPAHSEHRRELPPGPAVTALADALTVRDPSRPKNGGGI